jgi:hypothetical protein
MADYYQIKNESILNPPANTNLGNSTNQYNSVYVQSNLVVANTTFTSTTLGAPKITSISYPNDDTAADTAGGQTITLTGSGFNVGASVVINGSAVGVVSVVNSSTITFVSPALNAGSYIIYVINTDGSTAIAIPGIQYSGTPAWSTAAGSLANIYETQSINQTVTATGDAPITYSLVSGTLPPTSSFNTSSGLLSGTADLTANSTTYTFTIRATDAQNQDTDRQFSVTLNPDVVTWSSPTNNTSYTSNVNTAISNITLSATSVAGYGVTYSANTLPTGLSLTGNTISGTPTVIANSSTLLTATAATTNRTASTTINWVIQVGGDLYFNLTTLLLNGETSTSYWDKDSSTNNFELTVTGDARPIAFSPYETVWSNYFDGTTDYLSMPNFPGIQFGTGVFTIEFWMYRNTTATAAGALAVMTGAAYGNWGIIMTAGSMYFQDYYATNSLNNNFTVDTFIKPFIWAHVAYVRNTDGSSRFYVNGTAVGSPVTDNRDYNGAGALQIGGVASGGYGSFNGYISNLRVLKGTALYTSTFTPPTSALTAIANTTLLTCQSNRFIDNSTTGSVITKNGDAIVSNFGPFTETDLTTGSAYFDGTGDYIDIPSNVAFTLGTGNFTIEGWLYLNSGTSGTLYDSRTGAATISPVIYLNAGVITYFVGANRITGPTLIAGVWYHIAVTRNGTDTKMFVNGAQVGSTYTDTNDYLIGGPKTGAGYNNGNLLNGYISNLRVVKGTSVYNSIFTPPTSPLTAISGTSLLTLQNRFGENNNRFVDSSGMNNFVTRSGSTAQGTFSPFSQNGWSARFNGTSDYITSATSTAANLGSGDYTVEFWCYSTGLGSGSAGAMYLNNYTPTGYIHLIRHNGSVWECYYKSATQFANVSTTTVPINQWNHHALVRSGSTVKWYINGIERGSGTDSTDYSAGTAYIRNGEYATYHYDGYISNFRLVKGTALYTSNFTPSTNSLTAISGTAYLTCNSNRLIDTSSNALAITPTGVPSTRNFSPFLPGASYNVATVGGSMYFDGNADFLTIASTSNIALSTVDFTWEAWIYTELSTLPTNATIYDQRNGTNGAAVIQPVVELTSASGYTWYVGAANRITSGTSVVRLKCWQHLAVSRSGGVTKMFVDGVQAGSNYTDANNYPAGSLQIGRANDGVSTRYFTGYISGLRVSKGVALYTTTFTPPAAPFSSIANTVLLLNGTNSGIIDATSKNLVETSGDGVQLSTAQIKWDNASLFFGGTDDGLTIASTPNLDFGTGDFTIELWVYFSALTSNRIVLDRWASGNANSWQLYWRATGTSMAFLVGASTVLLQDSNTSRVTTNQWYHVAVTRSGTTARMFIDGTQVASATDSTSLTNSLPLSVGIQLTTLTNDFSGYMDDIRITKGYARYTGNFTAPTSSFKTL